MGPILLTGAGFSSFFNYPTTIQLRNILKKSIDKGYFDSAESFVKELLDRTKLKDIEEILQVINVGQENFQFNKGSTIYKMIFENYYASLNLHDEFYLKLNSKLDLSEEKILEIVYRNYWPDKHKNQLSFNDFFIKLHKEIFPYDKSINIFTTNYDLLIEEFVKNNRTKYLLRDGFPGSPSPAQFSNLYSDQKTINNRRVINFYKLHGSTNWEKKDDSTVFKYSDPYPKKPFILNPTLFKKDYKQSPFDKLFHTFDSFIDTQEIMIIIGYSFRDPEINNRILKFLSLNKPVIYISKSVKIKAENNLKTFQQFGERLIKEIDWSYLHPISYYIGEENNDLLEKLGETLSVVHSSIKTP